MVVITLGDSHVQGDGAAFGLGCVDSCGRADRPVASLLRDRGGRWQKVGRVLDICHYDGRGVEVELLRRVVGAKRKQGGTRAVDSEASDMFQSGDRIISDMLSPDIP